MFSKQLKPLKNACLATAILVLNFVLIPGTAWLLTSLLAMEPSLAIGLVVISVVAGAPLAIKASQIARADVPASGSAVILQVAGTVLFLPIILPVMIPNISVDSWAVASSLFVQVLVPIAVGLIANYRYPEASDLARPVMGQISNISLAGLLIVNLVRIPEILGLFGTGSILAALIIIAVGLFAGYYWPGLDEVCKSERLMIPKVLG